MEDEFLTLDEVAKYLKIPKSTVYKLSQKGDLPCCKIGKQLRFRKSSLDTRLTEKEGRVKFNQAASCKTRFILLIEDDRLVLRAVSRFLKSQGYNVEPAVSGEEALEKAGRLSFDLIITDIRMPGIDGIETIKRIREFYRNNNRPGIPEIIISGFTDEDSEREAERLGITDYIYKPFAISDFIRTVKRRLGSAVNSN